MLTVSDPAPDEGADEQPLVGVVGEDEVDVRVVDRRVPPERVVADVERVVRPLVDREARLEGGVEERRRDLADAAADPALELAVDDHRRLLEPLRLVPLAGRLVEREARAGCHERAVDQIGDELDVVEPSRSAAVGRGVRPDDPGDAHRLGGRGRSRRLARRRRQRRRPAASGRASPSRSRSARHPGRSCARLRGDDLDPAGHHPEGGIARRAVHRAADGREPRLCRRPTDADAGRAAARQIQELGDPPPGEPEPRRADGQRDRCRDRGSGRRGRIGEPRRRDPRLVSHDGQAHRPVPVE